MICQKCGMHLPEDVGFCPSCGAIRSARAACTAARLSGAATTAGGRRRSAPQYAAAGPAGSRIRVSVLPVSRASVYSEGSLQRRDGFCLSFFFCFAFRSAGFRSSWMAARTTSGNVRHVARSWGALASGGLAALHCGRGAFAGYLGWNSRGWRGRDSAERASRVAWSAMSNDGMHAQHRGSSSL